MYNREQKYVCILVFGDFASPVDLDPCNLCKYIKHVSTDRIKKLIVILYLSV